MAVRKVEESVWIRRLQPPSAGRTLVCFPHAGGAATYYAPLARALSGDADVVALQYPGRQDRLSERCIDDVDELVAAIVPELDGWLAGPFVLFGHSMGAVVAYEVARVLERDRGLMPAGLVASGRRAPSTRREERVHHGGDASLLREVRRLAGTPTQLLDDEDVQEMMLPALRGDYKAIESYSWRPGPPLSCPIWAIVGAADPLTTPAEAAAWASHTSGGFALHTLPGQHFYFATQLAGAAAIVARYLATV